MLLDDFKPVEFAHKTILVSPRGDAYVVGNKLVSMLPTEYEKKNNSQKYIRVYDRTLHRMVSKPFDEIVAIACKIPKKIHHNDILHLNGVNYDNHPTNLQWVISGYASRSVRVKTVKYYTNRGRRVAALDLDTQELVAVYDTVKDAANELGCYPQPISRCLRGERKTAYGYKWVFA